MKWDGQRQSDNVEDLRDQDGGGGGGGGGEVAKFPWSSMRSPVSSARR